MTPSAPVEGAPTARRLTPDRDPYQIGSAMVLATFVLALLTGMGVALLFLSRSELQLSQADMRTKTAFYLAESGLEHGRASLLTTYGGSALSDILAAIAADDTVDFDVDALVVLYDSAGNPNGLSGYGDDIPLVALTAFDGGHYAAFLSNDPEDGVGNLIDGNDRLMLTAVGLGAGGSMEVVQALVDPEPALPYPPATVLLLGPLPDFHGGGHPDDGGSVGGDGDDDDDDDDAGDGDDDDDDDDAPASVGKRFVGTDCDGSGLPGLFVPVIGAVDAAAVVAAEAGMWPDDPDPVVANAFVSSAYNDEDTVADLTDPTEPTVVGAGFGTLHPTWSDCPTLLARIEELRGLADTECGSSCSVPLVTEADSLTFVDSDLSLADGESGSGLLVVTGRLEMHAGASWYGLIVVVGEGEFVRTGDAGDGEIIGATIVGDIAGPDQRYGTADDCTGGSGGFGSAVYHEADRASGDTVYCTSDIDAALLLRGFEVMQFRQRD